MQYVLSDAEFRSPDVGGRIWETAEVGDTIVVEPDLMAFIRTEDGWEAGQAIEANRLN